MAESDMPGCVPDTNFVDLMKQQLSYGPLMDKPASYELIAVNNGTYWSLAIKGDQPDQDLPYVTIELISDDDKNVLHAVRKVDYNEVELHLLKAHKLGTYGPDKKLRDLCKIADGVFQAKDNINWLEFCANLTEKLGFCGAAFTMTSLKKTPYYIIEVKNEVTKGKGQWRKCYLGTQYMVMLYGPPVPEENLSVYWKCNPGEHISKVVNLVTQKSPDGTYMQLGDAVSINPNTYRVDLKGSGQDIHFNFINSRSVYDEYEIFIKTQKGEYAYLEPQRSGEILAVAYKSSASATRFRITNTTPPVIWKT